MSSTLAASAIKPTESNKRIVTYQLALRGSDGIIIASDRCERTASTLMNASIPNLVQKIRIDPSGQCAWVHAGGQTSAIAARNLFSAMKQLGNGVTEQSALSALNACVRPAIQEWQAEASVGDGSYNVLTLVYGPSRKIFRHTMSLNGEAEQIMSGRCFAGQEFNLAAFLPSRLYSSEMTVNELTYLAAYSVRAAHDLDSTMVDGLDIAVCRKGTKFYFPDSDSLWDAAEKFDKDILAALQRKARLLPLSPPPISN